VPGGEAVDPLVAGGDVTEGGVLVGTGDGDPLELVDEPGVGPVVPAVGVVEALGVGEGDTEAGGLRLAGPST
jgi:hypothetical protein